MALRTLLNRLVHGRKKQRKGEKSLGQLSEWFSSPDLLNPEDLTRPSAAILNFYSSECTGRPVSMFVTSDGPYFSSQDQLSPSNLCSSMDDLCERSYSDDCLENTASPPPKKRSSRLFKKVTSPFSKKFAARDSSPALKKSLSTPLIDVNEQKLPKQLKRESSIMLRSWEMSRHRRSTLALRRAKRLSTDSPARSPAGSVSCDEGDPFPSSPTTKSPVLGGEKKHLRTTSTGSLGKPPSPLTKKSESSSCNQQERSSTPTKERRYVRSSSGSQPMDALADKTPDNKRSSSTPRGRSNSPAAFALRDLSHSPIGKREKSPSVTSEGYSSPVSGRSTSSKQRGDASPSTSKGGNSSRTSTSSSSASSAFDSSDEEPASPMSSDSPHRASATKVERNVSAAEKSWQHRRKEKLFLKSRRPRASGELPYRETLIN